MAGSAALADNYGYSQPPAGSQMQMHSHRNHGGRMGLPRELKIMWRHEEHARLKSLPKEQRAGWLRSQWATMTPQQKSRKMAELQAHWNALPGNVRQMILERHKDRHQERRMASGEGRGHDHRQDQYGPSGAHPQ
jgi:hypothetical protein